MFVRRLCGLKAIRRRFAGTVEGTSWQVSGRDWVPCA